MVVRMAEEVSAQVPSDDFQTLEQKVYRTIELYKAAREARSASERDAQRLREQLEEREEEVEGLRREMVQLRREREEEVEGLRREMVQLRREREEIRGRVEKMLQQIDTLAEEQAAS